MRWTTTAVTSGTAGWTVTAEEASSGESVELRYATEAQARYIAAVLALGPSSLPKQAIIRRLCDVS